MTYTVNIVRVSGALNGGDRFACSSDAWELTMEIGRAFGWKPRGASYVRTKRVDLSTTVVLHDYRPGDSRDLKCVDTDDAKAWANALIAARRSPHLAAMVSGRAGNAVLELAAMANAGKSVDLPINEVLDEFIEFALGGAFLFARAD